MIGQRATEAIEASDTDELIRVIDGLCEKGEWDDELVELKRRCREAVGRGKQLWGVEEHIRYRLTLEAPAPWAGAAVSEGAALFTVGPLPEVAASTKTWEELDGHLEDGPWRAVTAAERVVRGEPAGPIADLPDHLVDWEPQYPVAAYKSDKVETPSPGLPSVEDVELPSEFTAIDDPLSEGALFDLIQPWVNESNGRYETSAVEGSALQAIRALGLTRARVGEIERAEALKWMAWAGASGGAHGHRRGAAAGRFGTWWAVATLTDLDWPPDPADMARALENLTFYWFDDGAPGTGWNFRMAIEDTSTGLAWAISAVDAAD